ncbi:MAG: hypothetical protein B0D91_14160 [Oceanospirillales bacterium LUC14_002_19_P2]|nr:MAG: hypothetical protein B0D91_14160 [Oceanospirillales bacterium LUC14_002_19_P2]
MLVVDPSQIHQEIIFTCLDHTGEIVYKAANVDAALSEIRKQSPDMVLLADSVSVSNDLDVLKTIRAIPENETVWLIAMSSETDDAFSRHIQGDGFDGYLVNPFTLEQFIGLVETCITKSFENINAFYSSHEIKLDISLFDVLSKAAELGDINQMMQVVGELQVHKGTRQLARLIGFLCRTFSFDRLENLCRRCASEVEAPIVL